VSSATVIVPSRGPADRLRRLLDSLAAQTVEHETLVVDNASPHGEAAAATIHYPSASALLLNENRGFSYPVNLAARQASGDALVLVNDDCVCDPEFVERIVAPLDPARGVVMVAGVLRDQHRPELIDTAGMELDPTLLVYDHLNGLPLTALEGAGDPIGPSAAAAAFDRDAFLAAGGFDENLFAYWEDVDLVLRLLAAGGRCVLAPGARGTHEHSATLGSGSAEKNRLMGFGRGYVLRKWGVMTPGRAGPVLAREGVLLAGQALIDGNFAGFRGRLAGWRAAAKAERMPFPERAAAEGGGDPLLATLRRPLARRRRLARR
jgi:N-acetylglucosaminyl-diphospho-decaprenol L-rhamnosyltransferase